MIEIGDMVEYNGFIPDHVSVYDKSYIKDSLIIGKLYKIIDSTIFRNIRWFRVRYDKDYDCDIWAPKESFNELNMKKRYGLR